MHRFRNPMPCPPPFEFWQPSMHTLGNRTAIVRLTNLTVAKRAR